MLNDLYTAQGRQLTGTPWEIYPRPQLRRESYVNLNDTWELSAGNDPQVYSILVPFCPESLLSGVHKHFDEGTVLCYRRTFTLPAGFQKGRVLLHVGAADQHAEILVNGKLNCFRLNASSIFTCIAKKGSYKIVSAEPYVICLTLGFILILTFSEHRKSFHTVKGVLL